MFFNLADAAISAAIAAGLNELTPQLAASLLDLARDQCHTDEDLARRFLDSYRQAKGIEPESPWSGPLPWRSSPRSVALARSP